MPPGLVPMAPVPSPAPAMSPASPPPRPTTVPIVTNVDPTAVAHTELHIDLPFDEVADNIEGFAANFKAGMDQALMCSNCVQVDSVTPGGSIMVNFQVGPSEDGRPAGVLTADLQAQLNNPHSALRTNPTLGRFMDVAVMSSSYGAFKHPHLKMADSIQTVLSVYKERAAENTGDLRREINGMNTVIGQMGELSSSMSRTDAALHNFDQRTVDTTVELERAAGLVPGPSGEVSHPDLNWHEQLLAAGAGTAGVPGAMESFRATPMMQPASASEPSVSVHAAPTPHPDLNWHDQLLTAGAASLLVPAAGEAETGIANAVRLALGGGAAAEHGAVVVH